MAERLKRAAAWLGLVTDDRYPDYADDRYADYPDDNENTESVNRDELLDEPSQPIRGTGRETAPAAASSAELYGRPENRSASVTTLEPRRPTPPAAPATPQRADLSRIVTVHPRTYNEARTIGEHFRDGVPVIMNLSGMEDVDAKRLVDFAAGLIFGLRGTIERVTSKVFLLSPQNVNVAAEDKERIAGGFFNQS
ncbi:cell division inhibitor SepF [Friedmanniella endophytica]|uniref:Cell division protein SepF n=1 Tax=Microlunatus kandeliicorticis TaxID=1759536 RepID=A0A7W3IS97_9ACTN|nr:cell division protein SepF [Microlunatus kandeliicorticis]MBA8794306.1 cell division inhibitor SepF [Microlunatus kandeliicorticis]